MGINWLAVALGSIAIAILIVGWAFNERLFYRNRALESIATAIDNLAKALKKGE